MLNFIDTNVFIAYCFEAHNYNDQCQILEEMDNLWLSDKVLTEWKRKDREIRVDLELKNCFLSIKSGEMAGHVQG